MVKSELTLIKNLNKIQQNLPVQCVNRNIIKK